MSKIMAAFRVGLCTLTLFPVPAGAETCVASFYDRGARTANGERFNPNGMTAAHLSYRFGTILNVTDLATGRTVRVRVTDRGPARWTGHCLDLARGAARRLGIEGRGIARVSIQPVR